MSQPRRSSFVTVVVCLCLVGALVAGGITAFGPHDAPQATWRFGPERQTVAPFDEVPMLDPVTLEVTVPFKAWVYTVSFSLAGGCRALFPSDYLATDVQNPLPVGSHRLPGRLDSKDLEWHVPNNKNEAVSYILVVSRKPLPDLHQRMQTLFQIGNTAFPDRSFGSYLPKGPAAQRLARTSHQVRRETAQVPVNARKATEGPGGRLVDLLRRADRA
jgi:hypothetical protein